MLCTFVQFQIEVVSGRKYYGAAMVYIIIVIPGWMVAIQVTS
jgi:hypothetical protein